MRVHLTADDRIAIAETISQHGHAFDNGEFDRLGEFLSPDVVYDVSDVGGGRLVGIDAVLAAGLELGDGNPLGHHVTNVVITHVEEACVRTRCKAIAVRADGTSATATYEDTLRRGDDGWRIGHRVVRGHREPLGGAHRPPEEGGAAVA